MFGINMFSGTAGAYASLMKLQSRWDEKKEKGKFQEKSQIQEDPMIRHLEEMREQRQKSSGKEAIINKMNSGKKLTQEEMEYLQREDPAAYQKAKEIQAQQKGYKNALKNCKTKEDVQRLKANYMGTAMARVNGIANDPHIPKGQKMALLMHENAKVKAILKAEKEFIASGRYEQLPTDAEQKEAMEQAAEAMRGEKGTAAEQTGETGSQEESQEVSDASGQDRTPEVSQEAAALPDQRPEASQEASALPGQNRKPEVSGSQEAASHKPAAKQPSGHKKAPYARGTGAYQQTAAAPRPQGRKMKLSKKA